MVDSLRRATVVHVCGDRIAVTRAVYQGGEGPMGRPIYAYELADPDFAWLLNSFRESHPSCLSVESNALPVVLLMTSDPVMTPMVILPHSAAPVQDEKATEK